MDLATNPLIQESELRIAMPVLAISFRVSGAMLIAGGKKIPLQRKFLPESNLAA
jgi:hypothetical protein